jgi:excisionase family DNA binding protein
MGKSNSDILTVEEAAELLKIPRSSVYKLAQEGKIPAKKVGRHWRFHRQTIVNWIMDTSPSPVVNRTNHQNVRISSK